MLDSVMSAQSVRLCSAKRLHFFLEEQILVKNTLNSISLIASLQAYVFPNFFPGILSWRFNAIAIVMTAIRSGTILLRCSPVRAGLVSCIPRFTHVRSEVVNEVAMDWRVNIIGALSHE